MFFASKEILDDLQVFWLDRMLDLHSFQLAVQYRFGSEPEEIIVADSKKTDPRLMRVRIPANKASEFQEFFRPYDVSGRPSIPLYQVVSFSE